MYLIKILTLTNGIITEKLIICLIIFCFSVTCFAEFAGGSGTKNDPWLIETAEHLNNIKNYLGSEYSDNYFLQTSHIDLTEFLWDSEDNDYINDGQGWIPIGNRLNLFKGYYDGNNKTISNLTFKQHVNDDYDIVFYGLFGVVANTEITNLGLHDVNINSSSEVTGSLVGFNYKNVIIDNCYSTGKVNGDDSVGGLVGANGNKSMIINSYSTCDIVGNFVIGGLVGSNGRDSKITQSFSTGNVLSENVAGGLVGVNEVRSIIENCYSTGEVQGTAMIAGLLGLNTDESEVVNCFSIGSVTGTPMLVFGLVGANKEESTVDNSYWNTETSGMDSSEGGEGRTTAEMTYPYDEDTYVEWDFTEIWEADMEAELNDGYPFLQETYFVSVEETEQIEIKSTNLNNFPNPFNPNTNIVFNLPRASKTILEIYNSQGQKIKTLFKGTLGEGSHQIKWTGKDDNSKEVSSGVYFYRLETDYSNHTNKMLIIK